LKNSTTHSHTGSCLSNSDLWGSYKQ
jgi:hypothetical protein